MALKKPVGEITRGTTNPNRLRRVDRYIAQLDFLRKISDPIAVDLGYGRSPVTTLELYQRLKKLNPNVQVLGIEIDPERVLEAKPLEGGNLFFSHGGFEVNIPSGISSRNDVDLIRAFNVLRQYSEAEVVDAWKLMQSRLSSNGLIVEGTCDEIGRVASWVTLNSEKPLWFTISLRLQGLDKPSKVAERLPKSLIHKNIPGHPVHRFLKDMDDAWEKAAGFSVFGASQRFIQTAKSMRAAQWPVLNQPKRWRLGELTVDYSSISFD